MLVGIEPAGSVLAFRGSWLALHVSLSFLGYAGWVVGAAAALMYPLQLRQLKRRGLMQKVLHQPTARMRDAAEDGRERDIVEAASYLFGLEEGTDGR